MDAQLSRRSFVGAAGMGAAALAGIGAVAAIADEAAQYTPGTYVAEASGMGTVTVEMTFSADAIEGVTIDVSQETPDLGGKAGEPLQAAILDAQGCDVDAVSGVTITSNAVLSAAQNCIDQARGEAEALEADDGISPIPPVEAPESWDRDVDVVVVGASSAGLVAAARLAEAGKSVAVVEQESYPGGCARITTCLMMFGGNKFFEGDEGVFGTPYHDIDVVNRYRERTQGTADVELLRNMAISIREFGDWLYDRGGHMVPMSGSPWWLMWDGSVEHPDQGGCFMGPTAHMLDFECEVAQAAGVEFLFSTKALALVMDGGACIGVQAQDAEGNYVYLRGNEAVVLAADGMQRNHKMLEKYCGLAANCEGAAAFGQGYVIRMGQGAGAGMRGYGSWSGNYGSAAPASTGNMLPLVKLYDWFTSVIRLPWLRIDKDGARYSYFSNDPLHQFYTVVGDTSEKYHYMAADELSRGGAYAIFDSNWESVVEKLSSDENKSNLPAGITAAEKMGVVDDYHSMNSAWGVFDHEQSFADRLADGTVKQADTLEELVELAGLDPDVLVKAVEDWNAVCESGEDDPIYNYDQAWLNPVKEPPFYIGKTSCALYASQCGLRVSPKQEVLTEDGERIPGLYAAFFTAGGIDGEGQLGNCAMGDQVICMSGSGWSISKAILDESYEMI